MVEASYRTCVLVVGKARYSCAYRMEDNVQPSGDAGVGYIKATPELLWRCYGAQHNAIEDAEGLAFPIFFRTLCSNGDGKFQMAGRVASR